MKGNMCESTKSSSPNDSILLSLKEILGNYEIWNNGGVQFF